MFQIPCKQKHKAARGLYGFPRNHSGWGRREAKGMSMPAQKPVLPGVRTMIVPLPKGKTKMEWR